MKHVDTKIEALRLASLIMTQSATAAKGDKVPTPDKVLKEAKKLYDWISYED